MPASQSHIYQPRSVMSFELRIIFYSPVLFLVLCLLCSGSRSVSAASPPKDQKSSSTPGMRNSGQTSLTQEQLDLQKKQLQAQQEWQKIQQQQLEVQKEQLQLQKDQLGRHLGFSDRFWQVLPSVITALMALFDSLL